jgi:hypothetical protein
MCSSRKGEPGLGEADQRLLGVTIVSGQQASDLAMVGKSPQRGLGQRHRHDQRSGARRGQGGAGKSPHAAVDDLLARAARDELTSQPLEVISD